MLTTYIYLDIVDLGLCLLLAILVAVDVLWCQALVTDNHIAAKVVTINCEAEALVHQNRAAISFLLYALAWLSLPLSRVSVEKNLQESSLIKVMR